MDIVKVDDSNFTVTVQPPTPEPVVQTYDYNKMVSDRDILVAELISITAERQAKIDELDTMISEAKAAGVTGVVKATGGLDAVIG